MNAFTAALIVSFLIVLAILLFSGELSPLHENNSLAAIERKRRERKENAAFAQSLLLSNNDNNQDKVIEDTNSPSFPTTNQHRQQVKNPLFNFLRCSQQTSPTTISVAFFGDSNTKGMFLTDENKWVMKPEQSFPVMLLKGNNNNPKFEILNKSSSLEENNIFAVGTSGLVADKIIPFQKSKEFLGAKEKFSSEKNLLDIAFVMFGTNDALKRSSAISDDKMIFNAYRSFVEEELLKNFGAKLVVLITPPPVLTSCPKIPFCHLVDQNVFKNQIVQQIRSVGLYLEKTTRGKVRLADFNAKLMSLKSQKKNAGEELLLKAHFLADGVHLSKKGHQSLVDFIKEEGCK